METLQDPPLDAIDEKRREAFHLDPAAGGDDAPDGRAHDHDHDKPVDEAKRECERSRVNPRKFTSLAARL